MPYEWIDPELLLDHGGIEVYHVYKHDMQMTFWYTLDPGDSDGELHGESQFDIRDLPNYLHSNRLEDHIETIKAAIETGLLTADGIREKR